jgi:guanylate kinase
MVQALLARVPRLRLAVSATTRQRRPGERDGVHYWFLSDEEFDRRLGAGDFLEYHVFPWGQRSGTLRSELDRIAATGGVPLLELELNGSQAVKAKLPGALTIFIDAPIEKLEQRLRARATESAGEIEDRIALAGRQRALAGEFDFVVENDDRERAAATCVEIVERELAACR